MFRLPAYLLVDAATCQALLQPKSPIAALPLFATLQQARLASDGFREPPSIVEVTTTAQLKEWLKTAPIAEVRWGVESTSAGGFRWQGREPIAVFLRRFLEEAAQPETPPSRLVWPAVHGE